MSAGWQEVGEGVFVRRHRSLDLNCGLVVGDGACLVVDTRSHLGEAAELIDALDACAAAWSAQRLAQGRGECVGDGSTDSRGRPMRICW